MDYKNIEISEDNMDDLHDSLCELMEVPYCTEGRTIYGDCLPAGFSGPYVFDGTKDVEHYVSAKVKGGDGNLYQEGEIAFVFKNGFFLMEFGEAL